MSENAVGAVLVPEWVPLKPISTLAFGASEPFHAALDAVTAEPDCDQVALHPCVTCWPEGNEKARLHALSAELPVLVTRTDPVKPVFQLFAV